MAMGKTILPVHRQLNHKSYNIADGCAYTEDHVMVYKLYVCKIPPEITVSEVQKHFSQYGIVKSVVFITDKNQDEVKDGFVHFESPTVAARVLNYYHKPVIGMAKPIYHVEVSDSWHQPNCQPTKEILRGNFICTKKSGEEDQFVPPNRDSILALNDDCLENIIRLLPTLSQLYFSRTCSRICQVFQMTCKSLYRTLFLERLGDLTQWQIRDFFDFAGGNIVRIKGDLTTVNHQRILKSIGKFCINLQGLDLCSIMYFKCPVDSLHKFKKLKTLKLPDNFQLLGEDLKTLSPTIESLSVFLSTARNKHIISLFKSLSNLKELNLGKAFRFNNYVAKAMVVLCPNLESLTLSEKQLNYGLILQLPKLKNLNLEYGYCSTVLKQLVEHKSHQLESLQLGRHASDTDAQHISRLHALRRLVCPYSLLTDLGIKYFCNLKHLEEINLNSTSITNTALLELMLKCEKLKRVDIQKTYKITDHVIFDFIRIIKEQIRKKRTSRTEPILLKTGRTSISHDILDQKEASKSLNDNLLAPMEEGSREVINVIN